MFPAEKTKNMHDTPCWRAESKIPGLFFKWADLIYSVKIKYRNMTISSEPKGQSSEKIPNIHFKIQTLNFKIFYSKIYINNVLIKTLYKHPDLLTVIHLWKCFQTCHYSFHIWIQLFSVSLLKDLPISVHVVFLDFNAFYVIQEGIR